MELGRNDAAYDGRETGSGGKHFHAFACIFMYLQSGACKPPILHRSNLRSLNKLKQISQMEYNNDGEPLINDKRFRDQLTDLEMDLKALEFTELRVLSKENKGMPPGPEASLLKIRGSEIQQRITELTMNAVGYYGLVKNLDKEDSIGSNSNQVGPDYSFNVASNYLNMRKTTIYGGSNEIQKNILTKMVLGL